MSLTRSPPAPVAKLSLWESPYRRPAVGIVIVVTVVAVEAMAVATVMPTVVQSLHGLRFYSWAFTAYLLASVLGMVDAGARCDRHGPARSLLGGLTLFASGLVVASAAPDIAVFLVGRVLQGAGGGAMVVSVYVVVARSFPDSLHPKAFAATSAAWVVPSLVGPAIAGFVASTLSWRWVFAGIVPLAIGGAALLVPVLRALPPTVSDHPANPSTIRRGIVLACGLGLMQAAANANDWWSVPLLIAGLAIGVGPLRQLLPSGALRLARGLPAVIVLRGILTCAFFGVEAYLPLTLARIHHGSPRVIGIPLTLAALGWSAGSWWQGHRSRQQIQSLRLGFGVVAVGLCLLTIVAVPSVSLWVAVPIWCLAGTGMGLAMPVLSVLTLDLSPTANQGTNSAALQLSDMVGSIIGIAAGGALVTAYGTGHLRPAVTLTDALLAGVAVLGALATSRAATSRAAARKVSS